MKAWTRLTGGAVTYGPPMLDDRGQEVKVLNPAGFCPWPVQGDGRIAALIRRMALAVQGRSVLRRMAWQALMLVVALAIAVVAVTVVRRYVPGLPAWVPVVAIVLASSAGGARVVRWMARSTEPEVATVILEEGLCPCCGYNFHGLSQEPDGCVVCPECSAAWKWDRMLRMAAFQGGAREGDVLSTLRTGLSSASSWTTSDDRGRRVELVHPRLRVPMRLAAGAEDRRELASCRDEIARSARWVRWPVLTVVWLLVGGGVVLAALEIGLSFLPIVALLLAFALAATLGNFCYPAGCVRRAMLCRGLCPSCTNRLGHHDPGPDGCRVCRRCLSAWRADDQEPLSTSPLS